MNKIENNRLALVTGGSRGIGAEIVRKLAEKNCDVVFTYKDSDLEAKEISNHLSSKYSVSLIPYKVDHESIGSIKELFKFIDSKWGRLNYLVNNVGFTQYMSPDEALEMDIDLFNSLVNVHMMSTYYCSSLALPIMKNSDGGCSVVNIASTAGINGIGSNPVYAMCKAAQINLTRSFARMHGKYARFNAVAPGLVATDMTLKSPKEYLDNCRSRSPLGEIATPNDCADVVLSLLMSLAFVNGQTIYVDGGIMWT